MYINELPTVSTTIKFLLYVDDSNILYKYSDPKTMFNTINVEMPQITEWFQSNKHKKTVAMFFYARQRIHKLDNNLVKINGDITNFSTHTKFLGISIDNHFTWKVHINNITTKLSKGVGILL